MKHSLKDWFFTTRPWSFPASAMPVLATFAYMTWVSSLYNCNIDWISGILAVLGIVMFHASGNMLSDVNDYKKGIDAQHNSDVRPLVNGSFTTSEYIRLSSILFIVGAIIGVIIMYRSGLPLLIAGVAGAFFTVTYSVFKYHALGDLSVFASYALIPIMGTTYAFTHGYYTPALVLALPIGLITVAILHVNNTRDIETDNDAGIRTFAMLIGRNASITLYAFEVLFPFVLIVATIITGYLPWYSLITLLALPKAWSNTRTMWSARKEGIKNIAPLDEATAQLQLIFSLLLAISLFTASWV